MSISFFDFGSHFFTFQATFITCIAWLMIKVERNPKMSISFYEDFFQILVGGGGVHCQEPKYHVDPKFHLNLKIRGFLFILFDTLEI